MTLKKCLEFKSECSFFLLISSYTNQHLWHGFIDLTHLPVLDEVGLLLEMPGM